MAKLPQGRKREGIIPAIPELLKMSPNQLDDLFATSPAGDIPNGEAKGTFIVAPGTVLAPGIAELVKIFAWQGKTFDANTGLIRNRVTPFRVSAVTAKVYKALSWFDRKECLVLDYSETSLVAHWSRDELRLLGSGLYLGRVYWERKPLMHFALEF